MSHDRHMLKPLAGAMLKRSNPDMSDARLSDARQREADRMFIRQLALAIQRGDHLPAGTPVPLQLIG